MHKTLLNDNDKQKQEETQVSFNSIDDKELFAQQIQNGEYDKVLSQLFSLNIHPRKLVDLYELMVLELIELNEKTSARAILRETDPMNWLRDHEVDRYLFLETVLGRSYFDEREAYGAGLSKQGRRNMIAQALLNEVDTVEPNRLLKLIGQALKWQTLQGDITPNSQYDLFAGKHPTIKLEKDLIPNFLYQSIKFPKKSLVFSMTFSSDGEYFVTGSTDGMIEVWDYVTGKLRKDLKFQAQERYMIMDSKISSLAFSPNNVYVASGSESGYIQIWKVASGKLAKTMTHAKDSAVMSIAFNQDSQHILSTGTDEVIRMFGWKSAQLLKEFRGHSSFVYDANFMDQEKKIVSGSSDGTVKIWDAKTAECLHTLLLDEGEILPSGSRAPSVIKVLVSKKFPDTIIVCNKSPAIHIINSHGKILKTFTDPKNNTFNFISFCLSLNEELLYTVTENKKMYCFQLGSGKIDGEIKVSEYDLLSITRHPFSNIIAISDEKGKISFWKA